MGTEWWWSRPQRPVGSTAGRWRELFWGRASCVGAKLVLPQQLGSPPEECAEEQSTPRSPFPVVSFRSSCIRLKERQMNDKRLLPSVINVKFPLQPHEKYCITQYGELGLVSLTHLKENYTTNSHYITYALLFKRSGECTFWTWKWKG